MDELPPEYPPDAPPYDAPPAVAAPQPLPFEDPNKPALNGFFETIGLFVRSPRQAFERMSLTGDLLRPVIYGLVFGSVGYVLSSLWQVWLDETMRTWMPNAEIDSGIPPGAMIWFAAMSPLIFVVLALINVVISHLCLVLVGSGKSGMGATLRVVAYAQTAMIPVIIPGCGSFIYSIWYLVLEIIGFAVAHKTTYARAALAVFVPLLLCCACIAICLALFGTAIMSMLPEAMRQ